MFTSSNLRPWSSTGSPTFRRCTRDTSLNAFAPPTIHRDTLVTPLELIHPYRPITNILTTFIVQMWRSRSLSALRRNTDTRVSRPVQVRHMSPNKAHALYTFTWRHDRPCGSTTFRLPRVLDTRVSFASVSVDTHVSFASVARFRYSFASPHSFPSTSFIFPLVISTHSLCSSTL